MVNSLDAKISKHTNDIIQKYANGLFKNATLEFYGIKTARIKELINVELPIIEVGESSTDFIFLLEDNTYLHFEFQTAYTPDDLIRFATYDIRLYARDKRNITTVVIYTADVKEAPKELEVGSLTFAPEKVMMADYNGNAIYADLDAKIKTGQNLSDVDMLNLLFLPLMRNTIPREELAAKSIELAQTIPDITKKNACVAAAFAFASKYLNETDLEKLVEAIKMTSLATMLVERAVEDKEIEIAKEMLKDNEPLHKIMKYSRLDESTIKQLKAEVESL